ncbi:MAG: hypothetical protein J7500_12235 [Sphingomonas sp.]|uniref:hypothetical protein n=1 Tax=Sphingomonas sp. TaxID=28214 RepID=UPI001B1ECA4C|nr:hypothetical protein [Sphingomonas sp.]MBO9623470.1 hypothetical protein [Sphingomonas sp.]
MSAIEWLEVLALGVVPAVLASLGLHWWRPGWSRTRKTLIAAAIVPGAIVALCAFVFFNAAMSSAESCGVDACGMAIGAAMYVAFAAGIAFLLGWACAYGLLRLMDRR